MVAWPVTLPEYVLSDGYREDAPDNAIRSDMDVGPAKARRRTTATPVPVACQVRLTAAQRQALLDFFNTDTQSGALSWDWVHPVTRAAAVFRFTAPPQFSTAGRGRYFIASLALEILP